MISEILKSTRSDYLRYSIPKYIVFKGNCIALFYTLSGLILVLYTVLYGIIYAKSYLYFDNHPQGTMKIVLSDARSVDWNLQLENLTYCHGNISCKDADPMSLNGPVETRAVTIATFIKERKQMLTNSTNSDHYGTYSEEQYYTKGPEYVVLKIDHAITASDSSGKIFLRASHRKLTGYLMDINGNPVRQLNSDQRSGKPDKLSLIELLKAAGVESLEKPSDSISSNGRSFRKRGCVLQVNIFYHNWLSTWFHTSNAQYEYRVHRVPYIDYSTKEIINSSVQINPLERLLRKRYALRIEIVQSGSLGIFSLSALLSTIVNGNIVFTIAIWIIEKIAISRYQSYIEEEYDEANYYHARTHLCAKIRP
ncbi:hypothetical protein EMCRGX_G013018 [Ephydatia muelleri]